MSINSSSTTSLSFCKEVSSSLGLNSSHLTAFWMLPLSLNTFGLDEAC